MIEQYKETARFLLNQTTIRPRIAVILGSGLGALVDKMHVEASIPYEKIPGFPVSTVEGHAGKLIFGKIGNTEVLCMQGRFHYYEGYDMQEITYPVRVMKYLEIEYLF